MNEEFRGELIIRIESAMRAVEELKREMERLGEKGERFEAIMRRIAQLRELRALALNVNSTADQLTAAARAANALYATTRRQLNLYQHLTREEYQLLEMHRTRGRAAQHLNRVAAQLIAQARRLKAQLSETGSEFADWNVQIAKIEKRLRDLGPRAIGERVKIVADLKQQVQQLRELEAAARKVAQANQRLAKLNPYTVALEQVERYIKENAKLLVHLDASTEEFARYEAVVREAAQALLQFRKSQHSLEELSALLANVRATNAELQRMVGLQFEAQQHFRGLTLGSQALARILQDLPYGPMGVMNNIEQLVEVLALARQQGYGLKQAFKDLLINIIKPPFGLVTAVSLLSAFILGWDKVKKLAIEVGDALGLIDKTLEAMKDKMKEASKEGWKEVIRTAIEIDAQMRDKLLRLDQMREQTVQRLQSRISELQRMVQSGGLGAKEAQEAATALQQLVYALTDGNVKASLERIKQLVPEAFNPDPIEQVVVELQNMRDALAAIDPEMVKVIGEALQQLQAEKTIKRMREAVQEAEKMISMTVLDEKLRSRTLELTKYQKEIAEALQRGETEKARQLEAALKKKQELWKQEDQLEQARLNYEKRKLQIQTEIRDADRQAFELQMADLDYQIEQLKIKGEEFAGQIQQLQKLKEILQREFAQEQAAKKFDTSLQSALQIVESGGSEEEVLTRRVQLLRRALLDLADMRDRDVISQEQYNQRVIELGRQLAEAERELRDYRLQQEQEAIDRGLEMRLSELDVKAAYAENDVERARIELERIEAHQAALSRMLQKGLIDRQEYFHQMALLYNQWLIQQKALLDAETEQQRQAAEEQRRIREQTLQFMSDHLLNAVSTFAQSYEQIYETWARRRDEELKELGYTEEERTRIIQEEGRKQFERMKALKIAEALSNTFAAASWGLYSIWTEKAPLWAKIAMTATLIPSIIATGMRYVAELRRLKPYEASGGGGASNITIPQYIQLSREERQARLQEAVANSVSAVHTTVVRTDNSDVVRAVNDLSQRVDNLARRPNVVVVGDQEAHKIVRIGTRIDAKTVS